MLYDSVESTKIVETIFTSLNSSWFPITMESRCFDVPTLKKLCAHMCWVWMWASVMCYSTWGWTTFTSWGYNFLYFRGYIWELISHVTMFLPLLLSFGRIVVVWDTSTLYGTLHACIIWFHDVFVISKCMWQICNVLQIYWTLCSDFKYVNRRMNVYDISSLSAFFVVRMSP